MTARQDNPLLRAARPGAREGARLMGSQGPSVGRPQGNFTIAGMVNVRAPYPTPLFFGVFTSIDDATKLLVAGTHEDFDLTCAALQEQFSTEPSKQSDIIYNGQTFRIRDTASDGLHYVFKLFSPT